MSKNYEYECSCGGKVYVVGTAQWSKCSEGNVHHNKCRRTTKRHYKGYTCGPGCTDHVSA